MSKKWCLLVLCSFLVHSLSVSAESTPPTLAERLGYDSNAKLLILHNDDVGMSNSVNRASIEALESGAVNSSSILVPPPWFPHLAEYAAAHPEHDWGVHLALTSEWPNFRWRPVLPAEQVPSLVDSEGYLHPGVPETGQVVPEEAEAELRAQIQWALDEGIRLTHLDTHMGALLDNPHLVETYLALGQAFGLPVFIPVDWLSPAVLEIIGQNDWAGRILVDQMVSISDTVAAENWMSAYQEMLSTLQPGVSQLIVHVGFDNDELQAIGSGIEPWGSAWRQREFDALTSAEFKRLLEENQVQLITWGDIKNSMAP